MRRIVTILGLILVVLIALNTCGAAQPTAAPETSQPVAQVTQATIAPASTEAPAPTLAPTYRDCDTRAHGHLRADGYADTA